MSLSLREVEQTLLRLRLVQPSDLEDCQLELGAGYDVLPLLNALQNRHLLTPYQVNQLRKGETDALVLGAYKAQYQIASGSFARVLRAVSVQTGQVVALKLMRARWAKDQQMVNLFLREGEFGKRLKHKNIVPIYEVAGENGQYYFTMEFVEGGNFRELLKIRHKFSPVEATRYILDMAEGLNYALKMGVTHRDLKLSNVLLSSQGIAKLVDFGLGGDEATMARLEDAGEGMQRAVEYATLEKGTGASHNDPRSDLYFLGAIYYELLTGVPPYPPTRSREERKQFSRYRNVRPVGSVDPSLPRCATDIVERLMEINPNSRYQTPLELIPELRRALGELDPSQAAATQNSEPTKPTVPTILCLENRVKHQDLLRDYFSKHGYRVLMLTDTQRALSRLNSTPPDCLLLVGATVGDELPQVFRTAVNQAKLSGTVVAAVLPEAMQDLKAELPESDTALVLVQPVTLRDIRKKLAAALKHRARGNGTP